MNKLFLPFLMLTLLFSSIKATEENSGSIVHTKKVKTRSGEAVIKYPPELIFDESLFKEHSKEDAPYVFEELSIDLLNKGKDEQSALSTIASVWSGNNSYDFITNLADDAPGALRMIRSAKNIDDLNSVVRYLSSVY